MKEYKLEIETIYNVVTIYTPAKSYVLAYKKAVERMIRMGMKPVRLLEIKAL